MPAFAHDGVRFNYETAGDGLPVVFCHGLGGDLDQPKELIGPLPSMSFSPSSNNHGDTGQAIRVQDLPSVGSNPTAVKTHEAFLSPSTIHYLRTPSTIH